jgi:catechol 2,3-dioxygenase-like lactoylglutathione lyase family enzyme
VSRLAATTYLVRDYDEAIRWFSDCLDFVLLEDTDLGDEKRWVRMVPKDGGGTLLLARAVDEEQRAHIGKAAGGRVAFFLHVQNFDAAHAHMKKAGVRFTEQPRHEAYGTVAVFEDLYGNLWDLIQPAK